jgi:hypothetical protein
MKLTDSSPHPERATMRLKTSGPSVEMPIPVRVEGHEPSGDDAEVRAYALELYDDAKSEVNRADSKGSILLSGSGIVLSALTGSIIGGDWTPAKLQSDWSRVAFVLGFVGVIVGMVCIGAAVIPKVRKPPESDYAYFFGQLAHVDRSEAARRISNTVGYQTERAIDQAWWISKIAFRKYLLVRRALLCFAFAFTMAILVPVMERIT